MNKTLTLTPAERREQVAEWEQQLQALHREYAALGASGGDYARKRMSENGREQRALNAKIGKVSE